MKYIFYRIFNHTGGYWDWYKQSVFAIHEAATRDEIKEHLKELHPNVKYFRRPKDETQEYFGKFFETTKEHYNQHHVDYKFKCYNCGTEVNVEDADYTWYYEKSCCKDECYWNFKDIKKRLYAEFLSELDPSYIEDSHIYVGSNIIKQGKTVSFIYKITNKNDNDKCYIGKSDNEPIFRWWQHLKDSTKFNRKNITDLKFEVIEEVKYEKYDGQVRDYDSHQIYEEQKRAYIFTRETFWINHYDSINNGYNKVVSKKDSIKKIIDQLELEFDFVKEE